MRDWGHVVGCGGMWQAIGLCGRASAMSQGLWACGRGGGDEGMWQGE